MDFILYNINLCFRYIKIEQNTTSQSFAEDTLIPMAMPVWGVKNKKLFFILNENILFYVTNKKSVKNIILNAAEFLWKT